jgi:hypothetical protein
VSAVKGARLSGLLARGLIGGATTVLVVIAALLTWPWGDAGPTADERRVLDLQRLSHAVDAFRLRQHILPASISRLPTDAAAPIRLYDPVTNRPYEYRPLGPLAYELCANFDAAGPAERGVFWWHDAGRYCFALEAHDAPASARPASPTASPVQPPPDPAPPSEPGAAPATAAPAAPPAADSPAPSGGTEPAAPPSAPAGGSPPPEAL